jgi:hypothetical protein
LHTSQASGTGQHSATDANEGGHVLAPQENVQMVYEVVRIKLLDLRFTLAAQAKAAVVGDVNLA